MSRSQYKPNGHRKFMEELQGDVLSFVVSLYDVKAIRNDFTLDQILETDKYVVQEYGYSQQELTFCILFRGGGGRLSLFRHKRCVGRKQAVYA